MKLWIQRRLRQFAIWLNHRTEEMVVPKSQKLCLLIENTPTPNFDEYFKQIQLLRDRWKVYDHYIESYEVQGRLKQFIHKKNCKPTEAH